MARSLAKIHAEIWRDPDWRKRTEAAQRLYALILSQPKVTLIGSIDPHVARWAQMAADTSPDSVQVALDELEQHEYVVIDRDTDELLIRTFTKHDVAPGRFNRNLAKGMWHAWAGLQSDHLRRVAVCNIPDDLWAKAVEHAPAEAIRIRETCACEPTVATTGSNRAETTDSEPTDPTNGSDQRFELTVPTNGSDDTKAQVNSTTKPVVRTGSPNQQIEPPVSCQRSPVNGQQSPAALPHQPHRAPAGTPERKAGELSTAPDARTHAAAELVARHEARRRATTDDPVRDLDRWLATEVPRRLDRHGPMWTQLLAHQPATTPEQLAQAVTDPTRYEQDRNAAGILAAADRQAQTNAARARGQTCPTCDGTNWVDHDEGVTRCPDCETSTDERIRAAIAPEDHPA